MIATHPAADEDRARIVPGTPANRRAADRGDHHVPMGEDGCAETDSRIAPIFRPVQYLGNKLRAVEAIASLAREVARAGAPAVDLFAGSTVVSQGFARAGFVTTAVDTQGYSTLFARAMLGINRESGDAVDPAPLLAAAKRARASRWADWEAREDDLVARSDGFALRRLDWELPLAWRRGGHVGDADAPLTSFYAGGYFGVRQALDLDAIRAALASDPEHRESGWRHAAATTALMHAASMAVHSAGKHFAQPLKARPANAAFLDARLLSDRKVSVPDAFASACAAINRAAPPRDSGHRAVTGEAEAHLARRGADYAVHYLDPPYTAQQYSRFYHVLETIASGSAPSLPPGTPPTSGLYPDGRYKSAFSSRRRAPAALSGLLDLIAARGSAAIVSYSVSSRGSDGNARMITLDELLAACGGAFGARRVEMIDLDHRYRQFNSGNNANGDRDDREVLVLWQAGLIQRYLGNKSAISDEIVTLVRGLADPGDVVVDAFSGSLAASFALRQAGLSVIPNDVNHFSWLFATAFMAGGQPFAPNGRWASANERRGQWRAWADELVRPIEPDEGVAFRTDIHDLYCEAGPLSRFESARGRTGRRRFFSAENAAAIDRALSRLRHWWRSGRVDQRTRCVLAAMLIVAVEKVSNTQGTYHDFPREFTDSRAMRPIRVEVPPDEIFIGPASPLIGREEDSLEFVRHAPRHRVLYLDPPYNFRQYTSYYFMLNMLSKHAEIDDLDAFFGNVEFVRGQNMVDDFKSTFCSKGSFIPSLRTLIERADVEHVVISYFDGRNHWGAFKAERADSEGRAVIEEFLASDLFERGSATCTPVDRLNYQSYGGYKARTVSEFLFSVRKAKLPREKMVGGAADWTGMALG